MSFLTECCIFHPDVWPPVGAVDDRLKESSVRAYVQWSLFLLHGVLCFDNRGGVCFPHWVHLTQPVHVGVSEMKGGNVLCSGLSGRVVCKNSF